MNGMNEQGLGIFLFSEAFQSSAETKTKDSPGNKKQIINHFLIIRN